MDSFFFRYCYLNQAWQWYFVHWCSLWKRWPYISLKVSQSEEKNQHMWKDLGFVGGGGGGGGGKLVFYTQSTITVISGRRERENQWWWCVAQQLSGWNALFYILIIDFSCAIGIILSGFSLEGGGGGGQRKKERGKAQGRMVFFIFFSVALLRGVSWCFTPSQPLRLYQGEERERISGDDV